MKKFIFVFIWLLLVIPCRAEVPRVVLETNFGDIVIELFDSNAPVTVENFMGYVSSGFYDGLIFHRVTNNPPVIQGGGFDVDLYKPDPCDPIINESNNGLSNLRGTVAMARAQEPNSATSQFYINYEDNNGLDYNEPGDVGYCVFGRVISDMNVVDAIADMPTINLGPPFAELPESPVIIYTAHIPSDLDGNSKVNFKDFSVLGSRWQQCGNSDSVKLTALDGAAEDEFGYSVSISADYAIVGARYDDDNGQNSGSAYIFKRDGTSWIQQARLTASDGTAGDWFGFSVSISGYYAIVGATGDDNEAGSAYIFKMPVGGWVDANEIAKLTASDSTADDWFGNSVSISGDYAIVGAINDDDNGENSGSAYIFEMPGGGWVDANEAAKLTASDGAAGDKFGMRVSISGEQAIVGAWLNDTNGNNSGSAYIFERPGGGWVDANETARLTASDGTDEDRFGFSVSISGEYAIVGAIGDADNGNYTGSAYIFEMLVGGWVDANETAKLTASDGAASDKFGCSVSIDGDYAIVGVRWDDDNGGNSGSAYIFRRDDTSWGQLNKVTAPDGAASDEFGYSVSISGGYAIVGAMGDDDTGEDSGSAYMFKVCPTADLNGDCCVDNADLAIFADNWLTEWPG